jgi:acyl carrier protein
MSHIQDVIRDFIAKEFLSDGALDQLASETRLVEEEIIDSLGIFLLVNFLQERFGVEIGPEEVTLENFESLSAMANLVASKQGLSS